MITTLARIATTIGKEQLQAQAGQLDRISKGGSDFATSVDIDSQEYILRELKQHFPNIPCVAEEGDPAISSQTFFLVDPIDGTSDFANRGEHWGTIIGYVEAGQPHCGVIYQPVRQVLITVERGKGCYRNDQAVSLPPARPLKETIIGTELGWWGNESYYRDVLFPLSQDCQGLKSFLSAAGSTIELLEGKTGAYINLGTPGKGAKLWDFVVGALAVIELGGWASTPDGKPLTWDHIPMQAVLARTPELGRQLVEYTKHWHY